MENNLLQKASILLTPTAYNDGSMLSVKPENGDGDFTFSRGSAATRVNAQGLVENVQIISSELVSNGNFSQEGSELVTNGDFATDSDWNTIGTPSFNIANGVLNCFSDGTYAGVSQNIVLEQGKTYKLELDIVRIGENSGSLNLGDQIDYISLGFVSSSDDLGKKTIYFKSERTTTIIRIYRSSACDIDLDNVSVKEVGQDWTIIDDDANNYIEFNQEQGTARLKFLNTSPLTKLQSNAQYISGKKYKLIVDVAEVVSGSIKIDAAGISQTYNSVGVQESIIEPTGTSFLYFYRATADVDITLNSVSVKEITDDTDLPRIDYTDGCGSWLLEPQSTNLYLNSDTLVTQSNATSASTYTVSFYGTGTITFSGTHTGTLVGTGANDRVSATFTATAGTLTSTISGTCEKAQLEQQSYATSYIPTNGSIATRLADVATNSGNSTLINSTEGVLYVETTVFESDVQNTISISNGTTGKRVFMGFGIVDNEIACSLTGGFPVRKTISNIKEFNKIAFAWGSFGAKLFINGVLEDSNTSVSSFVANDLTQIDFMDADGNPAFCGKTKALAVYKEALTDEQLQSLTTI